MKFLALLFLPFLFTSCGTSSTPADKALPTLASPSRAATWGAPTITRQSGDYLMEYQNPSNTRERVTIKGARKLMYGLSYPPDIKGQKYVGSSIETTNTPQVWQKAQIAGQDVYLYQTYYPTAGHGARFKTLGAELKDPQGVIGYYAVELEGTKNQVRSWLSELRFVR